MVARNPFKNPEIYGKKVQAYEGSDSEFQNAHTMAEMRKFLFKPHTEKEKDQQAGQAKKKLLKDFDLSDEDINQQSKERSPTKAKGKKRKHLPYWSSDEQSDTATSQIKHKTKLQKNQMEEATEKNTDKTKKTKHKKHSA